MKSLRELMRQEKLRRQRQREALEALQEAAAAKSAAVKAARTASATLAASAAGTQDGCKYKGGVSLLEGFTDDEDESENHEQRLEVEKIAVAAAPEGLPADFFDDPTEAGGVPQEAHETLRPATAGKTQAAGDRPEAVDVSVVVEADADGDDVNEEVLGYEVEEPDESLLQPLPPADVAAASASDKPEESSELISFEVAGAETATTAVAAAEEREKQTAALTADEQSSSATSFVLKSLELATAIDEAHWYSPFATALHSEVLVEEERIQQQERRAQEAAKLRSEAAKAAAEAAASAGKRKRKGQQQDQQQQQDSGQHQQKNELPWGFFDDFDKDAAARGELGPKELQRQQQQLNEKKRQLVADIKEGRQEAIQEKQDIRAFVNQVVQLQTEQQQIEEHLNEIKQKAEAVKKQQQQLLLAGNCKAEPPEEEATHKPAVSAAAGAATKEEKQKLAETVADVEWSDVESDEDDDRTWRSKTLI